AFNAIDADPKALEIVGGLATVTEAVLLAVPVPPLVDEIVPVVLLLTPAVVPVTLTTMVQALLMLMLPPVKAIELGPAAAVSVPLQPLLAPLGVATTRPLGRASVKATPF